MRRWRRRSPPRSPAGPLLPLSSVLPPLELKAGEPYYFCLTDANEKALAQAHITFDAVAPNTVVTYKSHTCMRGTLKSGRINTDLTGLAGEGTGGFAFQRDGRRAEFTAPRVALHLDMTGTWTAEHQGRRVDMFSSTREGAKPSLTKVSAENLPMTLTPAGAQALSAAFGASPVPAGPSSRATPASTS
ncbi:hypothetical protein GCM10010331_39020 [Streptomyces xanthochromogenes]|uniref:hypothetical protein n=1 Tax=Streptomyces xanthochromogenes TaxID=67384 RepID=UPI00167B4744|nr:hypothetical protein [Streptomyces xanthochromogenes]GHB47614.1 hypothetical protein GCM10010331_39020 [Streptomyces xanthochromogenes]